MTDPQRKAPTEGKLNSDYTWCASGYGGGDIEIDLGDNGGYLGCPHSAVRIEPEQLAAMSAGLAQAIQDEEARLAESVDRSTP